MGKPHAILLLTIIAIFALHFTSPSPSYADPNSSCGSGDAGGVVYRELPVNGSSLNTYGIKDSNEPGVEGVLVTVIDAAGNTQTDTTDASGAWSVTPAAFPVRVEFTVPAGLAESLNGVDSLTSVQFIAASDCSVDFGVHYPGDYSDDVKPFIAIPKMYNGTVGPRSDAALFSFDYTQQGFYNDEDGQHKDYTAYGDANWEDVGALYGLAYQRETKRLFASALLRRYADLKAGTDAIFVLDYNTTPATVSSHFNLNGINTTNGGVIDLGTVCRDTNCDPLGTGDSSDYPLSTDQGAPSRDMDAFDKIGKVGFGDIDLEDGDQTLWAVNLNQRALISVDVSGATLPGTVDQYIITSLPGVPSCTGGELRPWGLKFYEDKGYLGIVCDAQSSGDNADLHAYIVSFNPSNVSAGFAPIIDFALDYERDNNNSPEYPSYFEAWIDAQGYVDNVASSDQGDFHQQTYEQPFLADIEFFNSDTMFIGIGDRFGYQMGRSNYPPISGNTDLKSGLAYGDVLRSCKVNGSWILEEKGNPDCPTNYDAIQGVNNNGGEYFFDTGGDKRTESAFGALAIMPGAGHLLSTFNDPYPGDDNFGDEYWNNSGIEWFDLDNGAVERWIQMDPGYDYGSGRDNSFGKANGVGDVELLVDPAPLEIGNRLWCDTGSGSFAGNGVQDPGETAINGATVVLECDTDGNGDYDVSASATTDANGVYLFKDGDASLSSFPVAGWDNSLHIIPRNASCRLLVDKTQSAIASACGSGSSPTALNSGQGQNADLNDSDGDPAVGDSNQVGVAFTTGASGQNDHSFDFGFQRAASLGDWVWNDVDADGVQDSGETGIAGVTVELYTGSSCSGGAIASKITDDNGNYSFTTLAPGTYSLKFIKPSGYNFSPQNQNSDDSIDSDADPTSGCTGGVTLSMGQNDMTWDAGLYHPAGLGDYVWWDEDEDGIQDSGEEGLPNIAVALKDAQGGTMATTTTDDNGHYHFNNLPPGDYSLSFTPPNDDWHFTSPNQSEDDKDSDVDPNTRTTSTIQLTADEDDLTWDAGMSIPSSFSITKENTTAEPEIAPDDPISFTITIQNTGKTWLTHIPLRDEYDVDYLTYVDANPTSDDGDDDGIIDWSDLTVSFGQDLAPGDSFTIVVNFTAKETTENLPNHETTNTVTAHDVQADPDGVNEPIGDTTLPDQTDDATANILNPVGEDMAGFSARAMGALVRLQWRTASESNILGFNVLRSADDGGFEIINNEFIYARHAGADMDAAYRFNDRTAFDGRHTYILEIIRLDGSVERYGQTMIHIADQR